MKEAGLPWDPQEGDSFVVPDRGLDNYVFVLTPISVNLRYLAGRPILAFQGAYEWALDYILVGEVLWLPHEGQLRAALEERLEGATLRLTTCPQGHICEIRRGERALFFEEAGAEEAYARALLHLLRGGSPPPP